MSEEEDLKVLKEGIREVVREELKAAGLIKSKEESEGEEREEKPYSECTGCGYKFSTGETERGTDYCPECGGIETRKL